MSLFSVAFSVPLFKFECGRLASVGETMKEKGLSSNENDHEGRSEGNRTIVVNNKAGAAKHADSLGLQAIEAYRGQSRSAQRIWYRL